MVFQKFTATSYRDVLNGQISMMTSQHISAAVLNNAGTGYTPGDILTITHAGAVHDATIEVLTITGGGGTGPIGTFRLRNRGAFANRVATVAVNAGGTGYSVDEVVTITGGTFTEQAKARVTTVSSGVVTGVALYENGGAYTVAPSLTGAATVGVGPGTFGGGDDLTVDITMTGLIGTSGIAVTGGTGSSATFDLTLTVTGWATVFDRNDFEGGVRTGEREVVVEYDRSPADNIYLGFRNYVTGSPEARFGYKPCGFAGFDPLLGFDGQAIPIGGTILSGTEPHCPFVEGSADVWLNVSEHGVVVGTRVVDGLSTVYMSAYMGLLVPFGTTSENPYPMLITGFTSSSSLRPNQNLFVTGLAPLIVGPPLASSTAVARYFRASDQASISVANWEDQGNTPSRTGTGSIRLLPLGNARLANDTDSNNYFESVDNTNIRIGVSHSDAGLSTASVQLRPTPGSGDSLFLLVPLTLLDDSDGTYQSILDRVVGEIPGACWIPGWKDDGTAIDPEDTVENQDSVIVHALPSGQNVQAYLFTGIEES
jgi:hypothetical protein